MTAAEPYHIAICASALAQIEAEPSLQLSALARAARMSPAHFQRMFSAHVGVSPKAYATAVRAARARPLLASGAPLIEVAQDAGLSGAGRLHDLILKWEAMTPAEFARGGDVEIRWGRFESLFGPLIGCVAARGLAALYFITDTEAGTLKTLQSRWPSARFLHDPERARPLVEAALSRRPTPLAPIGGPFQIKVWEALLALPDGATSSYSALARAIGAPNAARAVGTAVGQNPLAMLIPCHRVVQKSGALGGYRWGLPLKRRLLALEQARKLAGE